MRLSFLLAALLTLVVAARASAQPSRASADFAEFTPIPIPPDRSRIVATKMPEPPPDLSAFAGLKVTSVVVEPEAGSAWEGIAPPRVDRVKVGEDLASGEVARRALDEVLAGGRFARARVSFVPDAGGVRLVVRVVPRKLIAALRVDLHGSKLDREDVLRAADLTQGGELIESDVPEAKERIRELYARRGYPSATVIVTARPTDEPLKMSVLLDVRPEAERAIEKRWFFLYGAEPEAVRTSLESYVVNVKDRADESALVAADGNLETRLRAEGYHRATVMHDLGLSTRLITLRVRVDTGPKFALRFLGNDSYDEDSLTAALALDTDVDRSSPHLVDKVKTFYVKRGFLDVEVKPEVRETPTTYALVFHIVEHRRVAIRTRAYPCLDPKEVDKLAGGGPRSAGAIGSEIDSYLEEELPGADLLRSPDPRGLDRQIGGGAGQLTTGARPTPIRLDPNRTYAPETWDRAVQHVQELYRAEGYLHALVGPVQVVRARCSKRSPPDTCIAEPFRAPVPTDQCKYDAISYLPLEVQPFGDDWSCRPDPEKGVECAPNLDVLIPVKLGPRTTLYDAALEGVKSIPEKTLADVAKIPVGEPVNALKIEESRRKMIDLYKDAGFYYAEVKYTIEYSAELSRARVRFDILEGDQVFVADIEVHGNEATNEALIRKRIVLQKGQPYLGRALRDTQSNLATLGVFSSVSVALENAEVPGRNKKVLITVVERQPQYLEVRPGFSTGEGFRGAFEYGHRNLFGDAVYVAFRAQASYLPDALIFDPDVLANIRRAESDPRPEKRLSPSDRIARRISLSVALPEIGLGPLARTQVDLAHVQDLERDFALTKYSFFASLIWTKGNLKLSGGQSVERNSILLFTAQNIEEFFRNRPSTGDLQRLLRVPNGDTIAFAQRLVFSWDRRDNAFNAKSGTYLVTGAELVNSFPLDGSPNVDAQRFEGHFVRLTQTFSGYVPISKSLTFAAQLRLGQNIHFTKSDLERTYPDRLFFLGGSDSMRGWHLDAFVPQDYVQKIATPALPGQKAFTIQDVPIRGGDLMVNPRFELRFPLKSPIESVLFADFGNVWLNGGYFLNQGNQIVLRRFTLRAAVGSGIRVQTPVGPIVVDYGINVTRDPTYEDFGALNVSIGLF